ncbi:MAG: VWA domain-containing protein [Prevotella sp.]|nr:VWA domain-containing protein [Prevotella sp.]
MKRVFNLIIVDESGSMSVIRKQAFSGMNETLSTVRSMQEKYPDTEQHVTLVTFDSGHMKWHYDDALARNTHDLNWKAYNPCAATPLYDAIGKTVSKLNAQVGQGDNVLVTIITDGMENCSREWTLKMVKNLIDKLKEQKWTFTLIGTDNLDVEGMAHSMSIGDHMCFAQDVEGTKAMFSRELKARKRFYHCINNNMSMPVGDFFLDGNDENEEETANA